MDTLSTDQQYQYESLSFVCIFKVLLEKYDEKDAEEEKPKGRQKKSTKTDSTSQNKKKASRKKFV